MSLQLDLDYPVSVVNAIRRSILSKVAGIGIDTVTFHSNSSVFWDEYIAHRMGMLPIRELESSTAEGTLTLCEKNETSEVQMVTAHALRSDSFAPMHPDTPLLYLSPNTEIHLVAHVRAKCGRDHMRFCPAFTSISPKTGGGAVLTVECHGDRDPRDVLSASVGMIEDELSAFLKRDVHNLS